MAKSNKGTLPKFWTASNHAWNYDLEANRFVSPSARGSKDEFLHAQWVVKDGWIRASVRFYGQKNRDLGFVFRSTNNKAYIAGLGGWGYRYNIAEIHWDRDWINLAGEGKVSSLFSRDSYEIEVRFKGHTILLFENGVQQLHATLREKPVRGQIGLYVDGGKAIFSDITVSPKKCFVVMPFAQKYNATYERIQRAVESSGLICVRSDKVRLNRPIMEEVIQEIESADLVIIDLSDKNANVYYEAGLAHAFGTPYVIIAPSNDDVAFDLRQIRTLFYGENHRQFVPELKRWISACLAAN